MRLVDVDKIRLPKGFFEKIDNVPKFYEWLGTLPTVSQYVQHVESVGEDGSALKHGHWIDRSDSIIAGTCSVCNWDACYYETDVSGMPYCPNCGAKMDEDELQELEITPCRGCDDYDGQGGCKSNGGCGAKVDEVKDE